MTRQITWAALLALAACTPAPDYTVTGNNDAEIANYTAKHPGISADSARLADLLAIVDDAHRAGGMGSVRQHVAQLRSLSAQLRGLASNTVFAPCAGAAAFADMAVDAMSAGRDAGAILARYAEQAASCKNVLNTPPARTVYVQTDKPDSLPADCAAVPDLTAGAGAPVMYSCPAGSIK